MASLSPDHINSHPNRGTLATSFDILINDTRTTFASLSPREFLVRRIVFSILNNSVLNWLAIQLTPIALRLGSLAKWILRNTILAVFCGGESIEEAAAVAHKLQKFGVGAILDCASEEASDTDHYEKNENTIKTMIRFVSISGGDRPKIALKFSSLIDRDILEKIQAKEPVSHKEFRSLRVFMRRVASIGTEAIRHDVALLVDAEEVSIQQSLDLVTRFLMRRCNQSAPIVYTTIQAYLKNTSLVVEDWIAFGKKRNLFIGIKLVRGAYLEQEREWAEDKQRPSPVWDNKAETDQAYDSALMVLIHSPKTGLIVATHNALSTRKAIALIDTSGDTGPAAQVSFAQLQGMSDNITFALSALSLPVAKYLPVAPLHEMIPYLLRRARENRSVMGETAREVKIIRQEVNRRSSKSL